MATIVAAPLPMLPVSLAEVKALLRISTSEEDALLAGLVRSAAGVCERFIGRMLIARWIAETLPASRDWARLGASPVRAIDAMSALSSAGVATAIPADGYAIDIDAAGAGWVRLTAPQDATRVVAVYVAGLATDANGVPEAVRQGIVRLAAHFYAHRDTPEETAPPTAVSALWRPWRVLRLSEASHV